jgi:hypothetical protein
MQKEITQYYLFEINDTKFHATVAYRKYINKDKSVEHYGNGEIQTFDDTFRCRITYGYQNRLTVDQVNYESKCDFNTFFKENHPKKLGKYLLGCLQFMIRMSPESDKIVFHNTLNMDIGPENGAYYRFYNLNNFMFAFYNKNFFEKYLDIPVEKNISMLEEKVDPYKLLSWYEHYMDMEYFKKEIDPLCKQYKTTREFLASFSPENYKRSDIFKDTHIWLSCYIKDLRIDGYEYPSTSTSSIWKTKKVYSDIISSDTPLHDPIVIDDFYWFNKEGSQNNVVITHNMVYGDCLGTMSDFEDD